MSEVFKYDEDVSVRMYLTLLAHRKAAGNSTEHGLGRSDPHLAVCKFRVREFKDSRSSSAARLVRHYIA